MPLTEHWVAVLWGTLSTAVIYFVRKTGGLKRRPQLQRTTWNQVLTLSAFSARRSHNPPLLLPNGDTVDATTISIGDASPIRSTSSTATSSTADDKWAPSLSSPYSVASFPVRHGLLATASSPSSSSSASAGPASPSEAGSSPVVHLDTSLLSPTAGRIPFDPRRVLTSHAFRNITAGRGARSAAGRPGFLPSPSYPSPAASAAVASAASAVFASVGDGVLRNSLGARSPLLPSSWARRRRERLSTSASASAASSAGSASAPNSPQVPQMMGDGELGMQVWVPPARRSLDSSLSLPRAGHVGGADFSAAGSPAHPYRPSGALVPARSHQHQHQYLQHHHHHPQYQQYQSQQQQQRHQQRHPGQRSSQHFPPSQPQRRAPGDDSSSVENADNMFFDLLDIYATVPEDMAAGAGNENSVRLHAAGQQPHPQARGPSRAHVGLPSHSHPHAHGHGHGHGATYKAAHPPPAPAAAAAHLHAHYAQLTKSVPPPPRSSLRRSYPPSASVASASALALESMAAAAAGGSVAWM